VLALPIGSGLAHVHVHISRLPGEGAEEAVQGIAAAQLAPGLLNLGHVPGFIVEVSNTDLDVNSRLRSQARNGRRPDVLDPQRGVGELVIQAIVPPFVASWPGAVISDHLDAEVVPLAALGPGESRPDDRHDRSG
jgi:hypothetical protein